MKKLFNIQSLLIFISILILSFYYNKAELLSKWATVAITILFFVISLIYMYVLFNHGKQYKKTAVKFALIMCGLFTIFFVRPYFEGSVLDYKFNKYRSIGIMNGEVTDVNRIPILSDKETLTEHDENYLNSFDNYFKPKYIGDIEVFNEIKQGDDFLYAIEIRRRNDLFDYEKYLVTMDSEYNITNSLKISSEYSEYLYDIRVMGASSDKVFFYIKNCNVKAGQCTEGLVQSIDDNGEIVDYFVLEDFLRYDQVIFYNDNVYAFMDFIQIFVLRYDLEGNSLLGMNSSEWIGHPEIFDRETDSFMHISNDNVYVLINTRGIGYITKYNLNMEQIDQTLFASENSHSSYPINYEDNYFYEIYEDESHYFLTMRYKTFSVKKGVGGEEIYVDITDQRFLIEDPMIYRSGNGLNYFEHKKLIINPILYINAVLLLLIIIFQFISRSVSKMKADNEMMLKRRIEFQTRNNRID